MVYNSMLAEGNSTQSAAPFVKSGRIFFVTKNTTSILPKHLFATSFSTLLSNIGNDTVL